MILNFKVSNFRSIKDEMEISFVANKSKELFDKNIIFNKNFSMPILKGIGVFGPNGSGKSNLLRSLTTVSNIVTGATSDSDMDYVAHFLFDKSCEKKPTSFFVDFIVSNIRYQYFVLVDSNYIYEECLYKYENGKRLLEYRVDLTDKEDKKYKIRVGTKVEPERRRVIKQAAEWVGGHSFLKILYRENNDQLKFVKPIYEWFKNIETITPYSGSRDMGLRLSVEFFKNKKLKDILVKFMKVADVMIKDIFVEEIEGTKNVNIYFVYESESGIIKKIPYEEDSTGTRRLFQIASEFISAMLLEDGLLVFDDVGAELHPAIIYNLFELYFSSNNEKNGVRQVIFSSHMLETMDILRRDQVYFTQKDRATLATDIYAMSDFEGIRKDLIKSTAYKNGIFDAYPFVTFEDLFFKRLNHDNDTSEA